MVDIESELFSRLVRERSLPHPTARSFERQIWEEAIGSIDAPSARDNQLCIAAIYFGNEIAMLRKTFEARLFEGINRRTGVLLSIAMANQNFLALTRLAAESARRELRKKNGPQSVGSLARQPISGPYPGSKTTSDSAIATIVDTIPHCLERAMRLSTQVTPQKALWQQGSRLFAILSVEHNLRNLWQTVLWEGWALNQSNDVLGMSPTDSELATFWNAWHWRQEMIAMQGSLQEVIEERMTGRSYDPAAPFQDPTVIGIGGHSKEGRRFRFGSLSGRERGQSWHAAEHAALEASYLAPFIDTPLPHLDNELSCRDLQRAWCVLRDSAAVLASRVRVKGPDDVDCTERLALQIGRQELERAIAHCCRFSSEKAKLIVSFFLCDLEVISELFTKGLWARPLVPIDSDNVLITLAAVSVGSVTRRVENWLDRGGLSDRLATARRGTRYEAWVRDELASRIASNELLSNSQCCRTSVNRRSDHHEQIDLLVRLGGLLIVGEVKCLLTPVEPMERYNYLEKLNEAGVQAVRKAAWMAENPQIAVEYLGVSPEDAFKLRLLPIVVVNQGAGFGLLASGARVVDFHFLKLYLTDGSYHSGLAFNYPEKRGASRFQELYRNEREAEENFERTMARPPTLDRFLEAAMWGVTTFPTSRGDALEIANCNFDDRCNEEVRDLMSSVLH